VAGSIATTSPPTPIFYRLPRLVTHIDDRAIAAGGALYTELGLDGSVLDLMSSRISHFQHPPQRLVGLGMNAAELAANPMLSQYVVHDLNADPILPFPDASFDAATCCVSVDYLTNPITVFTEVGRVLRPGGAFVVVGGARRGAPIGSCAAAGRPGCRRPTGNVPR
jgi:SAM-dependent methyltransferase